VTLLPAFGGAEQVEVGRAYLARLAATSHYQKWLKIGSGGTWANIFGQRRTREAERAHHLTRAKALFPDSETIAAAAP